MEDFNEILKEKKEKKKDIDRSIADAFKSELQDIKKHKIKRTPTKATVIPAKRDDGEIRYMETTETFDHDHLTQPASTHTHKKVSLKIPKYIPLLIALIFTVFFGFMSYAYFSYVSPFAPLDYNIDKPYFDSALLEGEYNSTILNINHWRYMLNKIGVWKLHQHPLNGQQALIEVHVLDKNERLFFQIQQQQVIEVKDPILLPDIRFEGNEESFVSLATASNYNAALIDHLQSGSLDLIAVAGRETLLVKGYKAIYSYVDEKDPSGQAVRALRQSNWRNMNTAAIWLVAFLFGFFFFATLLVYVLIK